MSRFFILLVILLLPLPVGASERHLGAPVFDTVAETTYRQVTWKDFKGGGTNPAGWNRWTKGSFAHIASGIRAGAYKIEVAEDGGEWIAWAVELRPYAVMDKYQSAVKHGSRNPEILAHEQLHFDVTESVARRITVELAAMRGRGGTADAASEDLTGQLEARFAGVNDELLDIQTRYDSETRNSQNRKKQKKWAAEIEEMLRQATENLVALLEERADKE